MVYDSTKQILMKTILLVEDDAAVRFGVRIDLEIHGKYKVWEAGDHQEALAVLIKRGKPHVVLTDVMMPSGQTAGLKLIKDLRSSPQWKYVPIIVLSARTNTQDILDALKQGATDYLIKPCEREDLLQRVNRAYELSCELAKTSHTSPEIASSEHSSNARKLIVSTLRLALWYWELTTQKTKFDLAEESKLWATYINSKGSYSTRTLDKYLHETSLPTKPRTQLVLGTASYVLEVCPKEATLRPQLEAYVQELAQLVS